MCIIFTNLFTTQKMLLLNSLLCYYKHLYFTTIPQMITDTSNMTKTNWLKTKLTHRNIDHNINTMYVHFVHFCNMVADVNMSRVQNVYDMMYHVSYIYQMCKNCKKLCISTVFLNLKTIYYWKTVSVNFTIPNQSNSNSMISR